jgi:hypothetical protein
MHPQFSCIYPFTSNIITDHMLKYDPQALRSLHESYSADGTRQLQPLFVTLNISIAVEEPWIRIIVSLRRDQVRSPFSRARGELRSLPTIPKELIPALDATRKSVDGV